MAEETLPPQWPDTPEAFSLEQQSPTLLTAVEHVRKMRGGAQSHLMRGSDGGYYVVKFQNNPQSIRVLANEFLASRIALLLGLPVPEVKIINVSDWLIENTSELRITSAGYSVRCKGGLQAASRYLADKERGPIFDYMPTRMLPRVINLADFARCLVFDKWLSNADGRQAVFLRSSPVGSYSAHFVDHGFCFNGGEWTFPNLPLHGVFNRHAVYEHVFGWESFEPVLSRTEQMTEDDLWRCACQLPQTWYLGNHPALMRLIETLHTRRFLIPELITKFRESSPNPFPNWGKTL